MASARTDKVVMNFTGGETTPLLDGRTDVERVVNGCRTLKNMVIDDAGAAVRRRGFRYIASQKGYGPFGNVEQSCGSGYTGTPIPANTYFAMTQEAADALAAAALVCVPDAVDFTEDFEGPGYENTWTESGTPIDDQATPAIVGSYSLSLLGNDTAALGDVSALGPTDFWLYFRTTLGLAGLRVKAMFSVSGAVGTVEAHPGESGAWLFGQFPNFSDAATATIGSSYHVWFSHNATTGAQSLFVSSNGTRPASPLLTYTAGALQLGQTIIALRFSSMYVDVGTADEATLVDHIILSSSEIGSNP